jgi:signal peptidase I
LPDRQDQRFPWSAGRGTGRGRQPGKHAAGYRPPAPEDNTEPGYNTEPGQSTQPGYGTQPGYSTQPGYTTQPGYGGVGPTPPLDPVLPPDATAPLDPISSRDPLAPADRPAKRPAPRKQRKFWRELVTIIVAAAALTLLVKAFVVQVYKIPSGSMMNTLEINDRVLVNKLVYHFRSIDRGDIVVFSGDGTWGPPPSPPSSNPVVRGLDDALSAVGLHTTSTFYIKRVIGLPGDHVACCTDGKLTVNGVTLNETSYLYPGSAPGEGSAFNVTVPAGHLWVMGDHREDSDDSLDHMQDGFPDDGTIPENEVVGRAFFIIWPPSQFGDLPIPATFEQAALHAGASGAAVLQTSGAAVTIGTTALGAVAAAPVAGTVGAAGVISTPLLLLRHRRKNRRRVP